MIQFCTEDITFSLKEKLKHKAWLNEVAKQEGKKILELSYVFCSDDYLLQINQEYLNHDTLTDIVTFDNSEDPKKIEGDIFISIDRVKENGEKLGTSETELERVMVHGLLHLLGYKDKKKEDKALMTEKEDFYIKQY
ncbi:MULTISPECIES: rRNA maturation RNase YbeY [Aquirufa]|jgi:probable rRNA maturation factor|uniref:Endoribonuclease YbeY n=2 Tax=Aquirufa TaxID=2676247 RepID=A0A4Q9BIT8_9BACT|nr:rRNA maturation RNase YbeY [Aquirufa antheringensis]MCE4217963.1 rRNA maturation RNase YbeY [Pseudarcicella sp. GAP-15]MCZ2477798.1 rRNA maturation RNase YbeY [Aquirufa antheringensis]MCZ2484952.1 rRNA maturation RNase YbeY [Aquirufa antheringensis]TBH71566.1 rRNA maturation RNase YbeY [Aquirufa antheringensis]TBH75258.1 rRNA maturation RNase YbeY [Aquirufa antheringensis]